VPSIHTCEDGDSIIEEEEEAKRDSQMMSEKDSFNWKDREK